MERSKVSIEIVGYASIAKASHMGPVRGYVNGRLCTLLVYDADLDLISETRLASFRGQLQHKSLSVFLGNDTVRSEETQKDYNVYAFQGSEQSLLDFKSRNRSFGLTVSVVKQILESVTHVHSKGFVVEGLARPSTFLFSQDEDGVSVKLQPFRCLSLKSDFVGRHSKASNILDLVTLIRQFFFTREGSNRPVIHHVPVIGGKTAYEEEVVNFIRKLLKLGLSFFPVNNLKYSPLKNIKNDPLFWDWETRLLFLQCAWEWCSGLANNHIVIYSINAMPDFLGYVGLEWSNLPAGVKKDLREVRYPSCNGTTSNIPGPPAPPNIPPGPAASANYPRGHASLKRGRACENSPPGDASMKRGRASENIRPGDASMKRGRASENSPPGDASVKRGRASEKSPPGGASVKRGRASENNSPPGDASVKRDRASENNSPPGDASLKRGRAPAPASVNNQWDRASANSQQSRASANNQQSRSSANSQQGRASANNQQSRASANKQQVRASANSQQVRASANSQQSRASANNQQSRASANSQQIRASANSQQSRGYANKQQSCASANRQQSRGYANSQQSRASANSQQSRVSANSQQSRASANNQQSRASANVPRGRASVKSPPAPAASVNNPCGRGRASENSPPGDHASVKRGRASENSPPGDHESVKRGRASENSPPGDHESVKRGRASENSPPGDHASVKRGRASENSPPGDHASVNRSQRAFQASVNSAPAPAASVISPPAPTASVNRAFQASVNTQPAGPSSANVVGVRATVSHSRRGFNMNRSSQRAFRKKNRSSQRAFLKKNRSRVKRVAVAAGNAAQGQNRLVPVPYSAIEFLQKTRNFTVHAPFSSDQVHGIDVYTRFDVDVRMGFDLFLATEMPKYFIGVYEILANAWDDGMCNRNLECFLDPSFDRDSIQSRGSCE